MQREIKFRAYDPLKKTMRELTLLGLMWHAEPDLTVYGIHTAEGNVAYSTRDKVPVMQYTGLKDKNGKEIYEGDIVQYDDSEDINHWIAGQKALVVWMAPRFTFRMEPYDKFDGTNQNMPAEDDSQYLEIIGNIYENGDLLK